MNFDLFLQNPLVAIVVIVIISIIASTITYLPLRNSAIGDFSLPLLGIKLKLAGPSAIFFALTILLCYQYIQFLKIGKINGYTIKTHVQFLPKGHNLIPGDNTMTILKLPVEAIQEIHLPNKGKYYSGSLVLTTSDSSNLPNIELSHDLFEAKTFILSNYKRRIRNGVIELDDTLKVELIKRK